MVQQTGAPQKYTSKANINAQASVPTTLCIAMEIIRPLSLAKQTTTL